jgi:hypothetical protein
LVIYSRTEGVLAVSAPAHQEELSLCPGLGARKVKNLYETFRAPFDPTKKKKQKTEAQIESFLSCKVRTKRKDGSEEELAATTTTMATTTAVTTSTTASVSKGKEKADDDGMNEEEASQ